MSQYGDTSVTDLNNRYEQAKSARLRYEPDWMLNRAFCVGTGTEMGTVVPGFPTDTDGLLSVEGDAPDGFGYFPGFILTATESLAITT